MSVSTATEHDSRVPIILGVQMPLFFIAAVSYVFRMYSRRHKLWWDDVFISLAMICSVISVGIVFPSIANGYGRHNEFLTATEHRQWMFYSWLSQPFWALEMVFIKTSFACMFLRLSRHWSPLWRYAMYFTIFYVTVITVISVTLSLTSCRPLHIYWDGPRDPTRCRPSAEVYRNVVAVFVTHAVSDLQFSLLPWTFVCKLQRSRRERVAVALLMSLGLLATAAGCSKFVGYGKGFGKDASWQAVALKVGSFCEATLGIVAANAPPLKAPAERMWRRLRGREEEDVRPVVVRKRGLESTTVGTWFSCEGTLLKDEAVAEVEQVPVVV